MGKRKKQARQKPSQPPAASTPFNNPFGALSGRPPEPPSQPANQSSTPPALAAAPTASLEACGKLVIQRERKGRRGKTVTLVKGLPAKQLKAFSKQLKSALGCGATIESGQLVVLGDLVDRVEAWLKKEGARSVVISGKSSKNP